MLSTGGGVAGILLGLIGAGVVGTATDWAISVTPASIVLAFGFSFVVGTFFGVYPAQRASRLDPIDALRSE